MAQWIRHATETPAVIDVATLVSTIPPDRADRRPWTWADVERDILARECLCCERSGHYQAMLEQHIVDNGMAGLAIYIGAGHVRDGHHRVVAAVRLGIKAIALETRQDAEARWIRDHGYVDWNGRVAGDRVSADERR